MNVALMDVRIIFQRHEVETDSIGNHTNVWKDYYTCWATASAPQASIRETEEAGQTLEQDKLDFTVRSCRKLADVTSTKYRIFFNYRIYDIDHVVNLRRKSLKFNTHLVQR